MHSQPPDWLRQPLLLQPYLRPMPWGGTRLAELLQGSTPNQPIGEAWLVSDHHLHMSRVLNGPEPSTTLRTIMVQHAPALVGYPTERFPLLVKLIDARENLSVQVHPDDESARIWAPHEGGKTEAWLVLHADPQSRIYLGLKPGVDREMLKRELTLGTVPLCLRAYPAEVGRCYFVPAGTVHALGAGVCVLEVQQTSDATFRLYDWGRVDAHSQPRPLHIEAALAVIREVTPAGPRTPVPRGEGIEELVQCPYFTLFRLIVHGSRNIQSPAIVVAVQPGLAIGTDTGIQPIPHGHAVSLPAVAGSATLHAESACECCLVTWPTKTSLPS